MARVNEAEIPAHFDEYEMATGGRTQNPGTLMRDPRTVPEHIEHEQRQMTIPGQDRASDKFAVRTFNVDQTRPYMLLPTDPSRKIARIYVIGGQDALFGPETAISNAASNAVTLIAALPGLGVWYWPHFAGAQVTVPFEYTSKQSLWACSLGPTATVVQVMVESFDSGTPIT